MHIRQQNFHSRSSHDLEPIRTKKLIEPWKLVRASNEVVALGVKPHPLEPAVIDKHIRSIGCVGTVLEILPSAIQQKHRPVRIERNRRKPVVVVIEDDLTG